MRIAALYDIHGNLPALAAVLQEIENLQIDEIIVGGDVILGPMSNQCLDKLASIEKPVKFILGNCETAILEYLDGITNPNLPVQVQESIAWTAQELLPHHTEIISNWPLTITHRIDQLGEVLFCHASPRDENEIFTHHSSQDKLNKIFTSVKEPYVVCGHTHIQFDFEYNGTRIMNAGSIGMPTGTQEAQWLLLSSHIEFRHTAYDYQKAAQSILATQYPDAETFVMNHVLSPPTETDILKLLEGL